MSRIPWREVFKFLSGAAFIGSITNLYLWWHDMALPFFGWTIQPWLLGVRGVVAAVLCGVFFYLGWGRKG